MKKTYTTNYYNTFIEVAEDTKVHEGKVPVLKADKKTIAFMQYELIATNPYRFTSDDVLFTVFALRNDLTREELAQAKEDFFSKGQACFRASPLTKTHGFGIHFNENGKMAIYAMNSREYHSF